MKSPCNGCGFPHESDTGALSFEAQWHREHMEHHLAVFPDVDSITVDNLQDAVKAAEEREAG